MTGGERRRIPWSDFLAMHLREVGLAVLAAVAVVLALLFVELPGTDEITGSVSSGGRPVVFGTVTVVASDDRVYTTPIRPDGTYRIRSVPPGPVRVAVSSPNPMPIVEQVADAAAANPPPTAERGPRSAAAAGTGNGAATSTGPKAAAAGAGGAAAAKGDPAAGQVSVAAPNGTAPPFPAPVVSRQVRPGQTDGGQDGWFRIPGRYASPATSGIRTDVRRGRTPFDIKVD